jgi:hypothetical protein
MQRQLKDDYFFKSAENISFFFEGMWFLSSWTCWNELPLSIRKLFELIGNLFERRKLHACIRWTVLLVVFLLYILPLDGDFSLVTLLFLWPQRRHLETTDAWDSQRNFQLIKLDMVSMLMVQSNSERNCFTCLSSKIYDRLVLMI